MVQLIGTQKFVDLGGFPIDPEDFLVLQEGVKPDEIAIYLRLFNEYGFIRRIIIMSKVDTLLKAWAISNLLKPTTDVFASEMTDKVFRTFSQAGALSRSDQGIASTMMRVLCLYYLPELRQLRTVPAENVVGVIFEYSRQRLKEYCYTQFALDMPKHNVH